MKKILTIALAGALMLSSQTSQAVRQGASAGDITAEQMTQLKKVLKADSPSWLPEAQINMAIEAMTKDAAIKAITPQHWMITKATISAGSWIKNLPWKKIGKSAACVATAAGVLYLINGGLHFIPTDVRREWTPEFARKASIALGGNFVKNIYTNIGNFAASDTTYNVVKRLAMANVALISSVSLMKKGFELGKSYLKTLNPFAKAEVVAEAE